MLAQRIGDAEPNDVGRRAVHRLEHRGVAARRIDVARRCDANAARESGRDVGQDVAEEVRADDHVKALGIEDQQCRQCINVVLGKLDVGVLSRNLVDDLIPKREGMHDAIRLGGRR